jgi:hypothetical protein
MRVDVGVAVGVFIILMVLLGILSFIGWDRWGVIP